MCSFYRFSVAIEHLLSTEKEKVNKETLIFFYFVKGVTKGHLVQTFNELEAFYTLQLNVMLYDTSPTLTNILHASFHSNGQQFGDRTPMLNIKPGSTTLEVLILLYGILDISN